MTLRIERDPWERRTAYVFISYASEDIEVARSLRNDFHRAGLRIWHDEEQLHAETHGRVAGERIRLALGSATDVVAVVSKVALGKPWVQHEWQLASAEWLASRFPRIHLFVTEDGANLPELPYLSLTKRGEEDSLLTALTSAIPQENAPQSENTWDDVALELRTRYLMGGATAARALHRFDGLWAALQARIDAAFANKYRGGHAKVASWMRTLGHFLDLRADRRWLATQLTAACASPDTPLVDKKILHNNLGILHTYAGRWKDASRNMKHAMTLCEQLDDIQGVIVGTANLALIELERGNLGRALTIIADARQMITAANPATSSKAYISPASESLRTLGLLANHEGCVRALQGRFDQASRCFSEHLLIGEIFEDRRSIAIALGRIAWNEIRRGRPSWRIELGLRRYREASIANLNPRGIANSAAWQAQYCLLMGNAVEAGSWLLEEHRLRLLLDERVEQCRSLAWLIIASRLAGEPKERFYGFEDQLRKISHGLGLGRLDRALVARAHS